MPSKDRVAANGLNSVVSSRNRRSNRNARKHGLSTSIRHEPGLSNKIEALAVAIAGNNAASHQLEAAREVAEAYFELQRLQLFKAGLIENRSATIADTGLPEKTMVIDHTNMPPTPEHAEMYIKALPELFALERYERRARSRSRKAFYEYAMACEKPS